MKIGDCVVLKSGGPKMTVVSVSTLNAGDVGVAWFSEGHEDIHYANLNDKALNAVTK